MVLLPGDAVPAYLTDRDESGLEVMAKDQDGWCAAIDPLHMRCTIYPQRPAVCRQFEMGGAGCLDVRAEYLAPHAQAAAPAALGMPID